MSNATDNPRIEVLKAGGSGVFTNYIYKAIPLAFDESMSYYETLAGLRDYLEETVIPTVNNNAEAVAELQGLYEELNEYVDNYFNNLDVQEEINNKLDDLVADGTLTRLIGEYVQPLIDEQNQEISNFKTQVNGQIAQQNAQIQAVESGSPLVATSISGMTDTTRVYVNTTDGHWYWYNGTTWIDGGLYQSSGIAQGSVGLYELDEEIANQFTFKERQILTVTVGTHYRIENGKVVPNTSVSYYYSTVLNVNAGDIYNISAMEKSPNTYGYIFADDEDNVISYGMRGTGDNLYQTETVIVPQGATKLYSSGIDTTEKLIIYKIVVKNSIDELREKINLSGTVNHKLELNITDGTHYRINVQGKVISSTYAADGYNSTILDVVPGEIYKIKAAEQSVNTYGYIFADDEDNVISYGMQGTETFMYHEEIVLVPQGATKLYSSYCKYLDGTLDIYKPFDIYQEFYGKNISIVGDSISTKINKNAVEIEITEQDVGVQLQAYVTYYDIQAGLTINDVTYTENDIGNLITFTPTSADVGKTVGKALNYNNSNTTTYWELLEQNLNCVVNNVSWSGASITSHEGNKNNLKTSYAWHDAQINKVGKRTPGTMNRVAPDSIIIYRGTNDFSHTPYARIDTSLLDNLFTIPDTDIDSNNNYDYILGMAILIKKLREKYPSSEIYLCTLNVFKRVNYSQFPTNNGINSLPAYNNAIRKVADYFGCKVIEFDKDGITFENCYVDGYVTDSATQPTHPNSKGHKKMYEQLIKDVSNYLPMT